MNDDRISLRLDPHELRIVDEFLRTHRDFASRSHLARVAIRKFIEESEGRSETVEGEQSRAKSFRVTLSPIEAEMIERLVNAGYFLDPGDAIRRLVSERIMDSETLMKAARSMHDEKRKLIQMDEEK